MPGRTATRNARNKFAPLAEEHDIPKPAPVLATPVQVAPAVAEDVCLLDKYQQAMRAYIAKRIAGEKDAELPVCHCDHLHYKEDFPCRHAGRADHDREDCDFDHSFFGPCHQTPLCRHDGKDYHDPTTCKFRHTLATKQNVVAKIAAPQKVVAAPLPPPLDSAEWVPLSTRTAPALTPAPAPAPVTIPVITPALTPAPVAALGITPAPTTARSWGDEVEEEDLDAEIARLEAEVARKERAQKLAKIAALKAKLGAQ